MKLAFKRTPPEKLYAHHTRMVGRTRIDVHGAAAPVNTRVYTSFTTGYGEGARAARARRRMHEWAIIAAQIPALSAPKLAEVLKRLGYRQ